MKRSSAAVLAACSVALLVPATALGSSAVVSGSYKSVKYTAGKGEQNDATVSYSRNKWTISDPGATIKAGKGCKARSEHKVICSRVRKTREGTFKYNKLQVKLQDGDDSLSVRKPFRNYFLILNGGIGNDSVDCSRVPLRGRFSAGRSFETIGSACPDFAKQRDLLLGDRGRPRRPGR